jgi:hypothetical protein
MPRRKWGIKTQAIIVSEDAQTNQWPRFLTHTQFVNTGLICHGTPFWVMPPPARKGPTCRPCTKYGRTSERGPTRLIPLYIHR